MQRQKGFTLTELLAVVVILSILSALSLGYYKRSVEQSRFSEGLAAASMLSEAVNRFYLDAQIENISYGDPAGCLSMGFLDMGALEQTHYFTLDHGTCGAGELPDYGTVIYNRNNGKYFIRVNSHNYPTSPDRVYCGSSSTEGLEFCQSIGYNNCAQSGGKYLCQKVTSNAGN